MADPAKSDDQTPVAPTARLPLRWGGYRTRLAAGTLLIVGGGVAIAGSNDVTLLILLAGTIAHVAGWTIMPSDGWRRLTAVFPATLGCWLLLAGPSFIGVVILPYLGWLIVRHRPPATWLTGLFVLAAAVIVGRILPGYSGMALALAVMIVVMTVSALLARQLDLSQRISRRDRATPP